MTEQQYDVEELKPVRGVNKKENKGALGLAESEYGADEKKKSEKLLTVLSQIPATEAAYLEDQKKAGAQRSKIVLDSPLLTADIKNDSKHEKKKNQFKSNAHFHKLFREIPVEELLKQSFTCALQKEILYQGKLFISENWICFHSKVFGKDIKICIPVHSVTLIKKTKTALLLPNALVVATVTDRYIFVSFLSRDTAYKLLKSVCGHLDDVSVGNSPNPSSPENSFRADHPTTLSLDFNEDYSDLDGVVHDRRQEMEEYSSTGSQTPESEHFQDYHVTKTQSHLKVSKGETKPVLADVCTKCMPEGKAKNISRNAGHSGALGLFHRVKSQRFWSLNHILIFYAILVCVLIFSTFYMRYKINALEERLGSMASVIDSHMNGQPLQQSLRSHMQINADVLCDELTANLLKLEKIQSNLQKLLEDGE